MLAPGPLGLAHPQSTTLLPFYMYVPTMPMGARLCTASKTDATMQLIDRYNYAIADAID